MAAAATAKDKDFDIKGLSWFDGQSDKAVLAALSAFVDAELNRMTGVQVEVKDERYVPLNTTQMKAKRKELKGKPLKYHILSQFLKACSPSSGENIKAIEALLELVLSLKESKSSDKLKVYGEMRDVFVRNDVLTEDASGNLSVSNPNNTIKALGQILAQFSQIHRRLLSGVFGGTADSYTQFQEFLNNPTEYLSLESLSLDGGGGGNDPDSANVVAPVPQRQEGGGGGSGSTPQPEASSNAALATTGAASGGGSGGTPEPERDETAASSGSGAATSEVVAGKQGRRRTAVVGNFAQTALDGVKLAASEQSAASKGGTGRARSASLFAPGSGARTSDADSEASRSPSPGGGDGNG